MSAGEAEPLGWVVDDREVVHANRIFRIEKRRSLRKDGKQQGDFFVLDGASWVNVVALTPADEVVMVEQWRHAVGRVTLEIPGGIIDAGESPLLAAQRELREESGFESTQWHRLGVVDPNPATHTNHCHTFLALDARPTASTHFDEHEECRLVQMPFSQALERAARGEITHALVVVALFYESMRRAGHLSPSPADY